MDGNLSRARGISQDAAVRGQSRALQLTLGAVLLLMLALPAQAATFRYSAASNRIYVEGGGVASLTAIKAAVPDAPLELIDPANKIWLLRANLLIEDGSILELHGGAVGGDVDTLRLQSNNVADPGAYVSITADYGTIDVDTVKIVAWDTINAQPDTEYAAFGRAFMRARSELHIDGVTPLESRMNIANSEISNLGFDMAESTGLSWKVNGGTDSPFYDKVQVYGSVVNSKITRLFTGLYFNGLQDGNVVGNEIANSVSYGVDAHDDTDNLLLENNFIHDNGEHGVLISKRVDHATIRGNRITNNTFNGLMLHRSSKLSLVVDNDINGNADAGISIFASINNTIRGNRILRNANAGVRMAVGANGNEVSNNEIAETGRYGIYMYRGTDVPEPGDNGRNKANKFIGNRVHDNGAEGLKVSDSDNNTFTKNKFVANVSINLPLTTSRNSKLTGNTLPAGASVRLIGSAEIKTSATFKSVPQVALVMDGYSSARFESPANAIFDVSQMVFTTATAAKSFMALSTAVLGVSATTVTTRKMFATPSAGNVKIDPTLYETGGAFNKSWRSMVSDAAAVVAMRVGDMAPSTVYGIYRGTTKLGEVTSNATGFVEFNVTPGAVTEQVYRLAAP